jgi:hypothetical protein
MLAAASLVELGLLDNLDLVDNQRDYPRRPRRTKIIPMQVENSL